MFHIEGAEACFVKGPIEVPEISRNVYIVYNPDHDRHEAWLDSEISDGEEEEIWENLLDEEEDYIIPGLYTLEMVEEQNIKIRRRPE
jgi:hypothetical protein